MESTFYLRWDGACLKKPGDAELAERWCNDRLKIVSTTAPTPPSKSGSVTTAPQSRRGPALRAQRAELTLISVSSAFAPIEECADIKISIKNIEKVGCVVLQIYDVTDKLVYAERLTQKALWGLAKHVTQPPTDVPPLATVSTDDAQARAKKEKARADDRWTWATPLGSPYRVVLWITDKRCIDPKSTAEIELTNKERGKGKDRVLRNTVMEGKKALLAIDQTSVRYHSIRIEAVPWGDLYKAASDAADLSKPGGGSSPQGRMWAQYKLNELGFWAGPIDGIASDDLKKCVVRFKLAHPDLSGWKDDKTPYDEKPTPGGHEQVLGSKLAALEELSDPLFDLLADENTKRNFGRPIFDPVIDFASPELKDTVDRKLFVEAHRFFVSETSEFGLDTKNPEKKTDCERSFMTNPYVPVRARVLVRDKAGNGKDVPLAVGKAAIVWSYSDEGEEDLVTAHAAPDLPAHTDTAPSRTKDFVRRTQRAFKQGSRFGVPEGCGGLLTGKAASDAAVAFAQCKALDPTPYTPKHGGVLTFAYSNDAKKTALVGSSIVYLRASTIAGDNYRLKAQIDLSESGHPKGELWKSLHGGLGAAQSGRFIVFRRARVAAFTTWPARTGGFNLSAELASVKAEFDPCLFELDVASVTQYAIAQVFKDADLYEVYDTSKDIEPKLKSFLKTQSLSPASVYPGDCETSSDMPTFDVFVNLLARLAVQKASQKTIQARLTAQNRATSQKAIKTYKDLALDVYNLIRMAEAWRDKVGANAHVAAAGTHISGALRACFTTLGVAPLGEPPVDLELAPLFDPTTITQVAVSTATITVAQIEELVMTKPLRDEVARFTAYQDGVSPATDLAASYTFGLSACLRNTVADAPALKDEYVGMVNEYIAKICKNGSFIKDSSGARNEILMARRYYVNRRANGILFPCKTRLSEIYEKRVRKKLAADGKATDGIVMLDYIANAPVTIDGATYIADAMAFGGLNGTVLLDQGLKSKFYSLAAHEIAHCMFLMHAINAPSSAINLRLHDERDDNCIMSYPYATASADYDGVAQRRVLEGMYRDMISVGVHYCYDVFSPHFCGKCNLTVRGWDIRGLAVPLASTPQSGPVKTAPVRKVEVRFLPGTRDDTALGDDSAAPTMMGISFYPSDKAGAQKAARQAFVLSALTAFPTAFGYNEDAAKDPAAFRVEVIDPNVAGDTVKVTLEALLPIYDASDKCIGAEPFPPSERARRALIGVDCQRVVGLTDCFRSRYLRLVTDEADREALLANKQGLLVTDLADGLDSPEDVIEILDQTIRVTYDPTP
jgi:hypothetical protein